VKRLIFIFFILTTYSQACEWKDNIPCVTVYPNSNKLDFKIQPTNTVTQKEIKTFNLITLNKVLNFVNGTNAVQSGPIGQTSSVILRGTNRNHT